VNTVLSVVTAVAACAAALSAALMSRRAAKLKAEMAAARVEASLKLAEASTPLKPGEQLPEYKINVPRLRGTRVDIYLRGVPRPASRSRSASGLTRIAASVLPASERDRYAESSSPNCTTWPRQAAAARGR
jgi:hypothetical protein